MPHRVLPAVKPRFCFTYWMSGTTGNDHIRSDSPHKLPFDKSIIPIDLTEVEMKAWKLLSQHHTRKLLGIFL